MQHEDTHGSRLLSSSVTSSVDSDYLSERSLSSRSSEAGSVRTSGSRQSYTPSVRSFSVPLTRYTTPDVLGQKRPLEDDAHTSNNDHGNKRQRQHTVIPPTTQANNTNNDDGSDTEGVPSPVQTTTTPGASQPAPDDDEAAAQVLMTNLFHRSVIMYPENAPFIDMDKQYTNVRGTLEPATQYHDALRQHSEDQTQRMFHRSQWDPVPPNDNRTERSSSTSSSRSVSLGNSDTESEDFVREHAPDAPALPPPLPPRICDIPADIHNFAARLLNDMEASQVKYVTAPYPPIEQMERMQQARFARDGIVNVQDAMGKCKICNFAFEEKYERQQTTVMRRFNALMKEINLPNVESGCTRASTYWNKHMHGLLKNLNLQAVPAITPSEVEIHWRYCISNRGVVIQYNLMILDYLKRAILQNQLYARQYVAGVPTNEFRVTEQGLSNFCKALNMENEQARLLLGAKMAEASDPNSTLDPFAATRLGNITRNELQRQVKRTNQQNRSIVNSGILGDAQSAFGGGGGGARR